MPASRKQAGRFPLGAVFEQAQFEVASDVGIAGKVVSGNSGLFEQVGNINHLEWGMGNGEWGMGNW